MELELELRGKQQSGPVAELELVRVRVQARVQVRVRVRVRVQVGEPEQAFWICVSKESFCLFFVVVRIGAIVILVLTKIDS